jgi:RNA polymerase sigma factor (sigma-70 family)
MANGQLGQVLRPGRKRGGSETAAEPTDGQLLERFTTQQDETAFETLVQRHGPMVLGVCRRVLQDAHDAEDAFQATFLVLVRKAGSLGRPELLGNWLYGVAYRIAIKARANAARRCAYERQAAQMPTADPILEAGWREVRAVLDEEMNRLPEKYRAPLVLCYLEGKTNDEAARQLGWPAGSMSWRLARGREILRRRLAGRGLAYSGGPFATLLAQQAAPPVLPAGLVKASVQAALGFAAHPVATAGAASTSAAALAEALLKAMSFARLKWAAAMLLAGAMLAMSAGLLAYHAWAADPGGGTPGCVGPSSCGG